jgi:ribonuclease P protein component
MAAAENFRFPRPLRLRGRHAFTRLFREGKRVGDQRLQVWAVRNGLEYSRFGLVVGRRHGNACRRNRIKRVLREAFRLSRTKMPKGLDIACAPRVGAEIRLQPIIESLVRLGNRLARSLRSA